MPGIPTYDQTVAAPDTISNRMVNPRASGNPLGAGIAALGAGATNLGNEWDVAQQRQADERSKVWAGQQAGTSMLNETQTLEQAKRAAPPGADGFTDSYLKGFDDRAAEALKSAPDESSKRYLQGMLQIQRNHLGLEARAFQFQAGDLDAVTRYGSTIDTFAKTAQQTPEIYGTALTVLGQTMPNVKPEVREKLIEQARISMTNAAASGMLSRAPTVGDDGKPQGGPYAVRDATSKALGENGYSGPSGVPWVDAATPDQVRTWNNAAQVRIKQIETQLRVTQDRQSAHADGALAYQSIVGSGPAGAGALPRNIGAPDLPAYDQTSVDRVSSFVKNPSAYDDTIAAAAKKYGVDPAEIKLKIGMESGGNPKAVNPQTGATGLGQFMPATAQRYGITDRTDPAQSIDGIAHMLADNGGKAGGDMSKADRAYYGGNVSAKGPNTDQYVENTRAVRQSLVSSGTMPQLSTAQLEYAEQAVLDRASVLAEQRKPGDAVYRDQVVAEARANWSKALQAQRGQDYGNFSTVLGSVIKTGATTLSDLPPDVQDTASKLTPQNYLSIQAQFDRNVKQANGEFSKSDPKLVNDLRARIYLPDGDPNKITYPGQLAPFMTSINHTDFEHIRLEMAQANTPEGNPFLKQINGVKETARKMLTGSASVSLFGAGHPELAEEAAYRFANDLDSKIKAARAAGQDPQSLLTPGSKDYVLDPNRVGAFMPTEAQMTAAKAARAAPAGPAKVSSDSEYLSLPPGTIFIAPDGSRRQKPS